MATLYIVGTPIGNLEDITLRALKVLGSVDVILCEDTRMTKRLIARHFCHTAVEHLPRLLSYHAHSKLSRVDEIVRLLKGNGSAGNSNSGQNIALVSDAGTPGISDPGAELVSQVRKELADEIKSGTVKIESIPGPSALTAALSIAGVPCADFVFLGFLPHKKGRETLFKEMAGSERTCIFYESPHRIVKTLESLVTHTEATLKKVTVCRELTKIFEEVVQGTPQEVLAYFNTHNDKVRGEFVVIVS